MLSSGNAVQIQYAVLGNSCSHCVQLKGCLFRGQINSDPNQFVLTLLLLSPGKYCAKC